MSYYYFLCLLITTLMLKYLIIRIIIIRNSRSEVDLSSTHKYKLVLQKFICGHLKVFFNNLHNFFKFIYICIKLLKATGTNDHYL